MKPGRLFILNAGIYGSPAGPGGQFAYQGSAVVPPLWRDGWTAYAAGNWESNIAPAGWIGETAGGGGSPHAIINPGAGTVSFSSDNLGTGMPNGAYRIPPTGFNPAFPFRLSLAVAWYNAASAFAPQTLGLMAGSTNGSTSGGFQVLAQCSAGSTQFQIALHAFGVTKGVVNVAPAMGVFYQLEMEHDSAGNVNGWFGGSKLLTTPYAAVPGSNVGINVGTVGTGAGLNVGAAIGAIQLVGHT